MKKFSTLIFFTLICFNIFSVCSASEIPLELQMQTKWYSTFNDDKSLAWSVSTDPIISEDVMIVPTPDEIYWKVYQALRSKHYGFDVSKEVATEQAAQYASHYNYDISNAKKQTVQYWIGTVKDKKELLFTKVSVDLKEFKYRAIKQYSVEKGENTSWNANVLQDSWHMIDSNQVVKKSLEYLFLNKMGVFADKTGENASESNESL